MPLLEDKTKKVGKMSAFEAKLKQNRSSILSTFLAITILAVNLLLSGWVLSLLSDTQEVSVGRAEIVSINEEDYEVVRQDRLKRLNATVDTTPVNNPFVQR